MQICDCEYQRKMSMPKSKLIKINSRENMNIIKEHLSEEYDIKENFFDPSKSSPPNEFMMKLFKRMSYFEGNNDNNLDNE